MDSSKIFKPTLNSGVLYARVRGVLEGFVSVGGVEELTLSISEDIKKQSDYSRPGGGTRATVSRISSVEMTAKLQDLNAVNIARAVFGNTSEVVSGTVTGEAHVGYLGGLLTLAKPSPTSVVLKKGGTTIASTNYEVRPEGIYILPAAAGITNGDALTVDYAHSGYDVVEALTTVAPELEMRFGGLNEASNGSPVVVDLFRVKLGATAGFGLVQSDFATLDVKGEVLLDPTKTGVGKSQFFSIKLA